MSGFGNAMKKIASPLLGIAGTVGGALLGGPAGAAIGGGLGKSVAGLFGADDSSNSESSQSDQPTNSYGETEEQRRARLMNNQTRMV